VPSILEMLDIPYVGSDPECLAVCLDKHLTKKLLKMEGIPTPEWRLIANQQEKNENVWKGFPFPALSNLLFEGSSKGIHANSLVDSATQAAATVSEMLETYRQPVLVEQFIDGDEVYGRHAGKFPGESIGMMKIMPRKQSNRFVYTVEVKRDWKNLVDYECPARLKEATTKKIAEYSRKTFEMLGCRDFSRIDFRVSADAYHICWR